MTAFLDTNLLIYAQGVDAKGETARQAILAGGVISVQVVNEFAAVLRRKFGLEWDAIAEAVADLRTALDPVRPVTIDTHEGATALARSHGFGFYDSLIVASALEAGVRHAADGRPSGRPTHRRSDDRQSVHLTGRIPQSSRRCRDGFTRGGRSGGPRTVHPVRQHPGGIRPRGEFGHSLYI